jgi:DNA-binding GntR family transcriptional regulator
LASNPKPARATATKPVLATPLNSNSLVDQLVERLEEAIMNGELPPGHRLSEQTLADNLGVSRSPLREALRQLEGRRLVERVRNVGARVTMTVGRDLEEILVIREALEALAAKLAAVNMTDQQLEELEELLKTRRDRKEAHGRELYDGFDFHVRIIEASGNKKLVDMLQGDLYYLMRIHRYRSSSTPERSKLAPVEHRKIVEALKARDPEAAEKAMYQHLANSHANIRRKNTNPK